MYLEEAYDGGSLCDLPGRRVPRRSVVRVSFCIHALSRPLSRVVIVSEKIFRLI